MPWNGSGDFSLSDTIAPATNADANELQAILTDIGVGIDASVAANGESTITGALKGSDGTALLPAYAFAADLNTGIYRKGSDNVGVSCGGAEVLDVTTAGASVTGVFSATSFPDGQAFVSTDAGAAVGPTLDLYRDSASPAASDNLAAIDFNGRDSAGNKQLYARIKAQIVATTSTAESALWQFQQVIAGTLTTILSTTATTISSALILTLSNVTNALSLAGGTTAQRSGSPTAGDTRYNTTLNGLEYWNGTAWIVLGQAPTITKLITGGPLTYTAPTGMVRARVRMLGGGAGGGATITNAGSNGTASSFQVNATGTAWTANLGSGGAAGGANGSAGGAGSAAGTDGSTGTLVVRVRGQDGYDGMGASSLRQDGGPGGNSVFAGGGSGGGGGTAGVGKPNTGGGGAGAGNTSANGGGGGGAGEYVEFWVTGMATATYTVGAGGNGGAAGTNAGGNGAAGIIIVEEFYS